MRTICYDLLRQELEGYDIRIHVSFAWSFSRKIGCAERNNKGNWNVKVNLRKAESAFFSTLKTEMFNVHYAMAYLAAYLRELEGSSDCSDLAKMYGNHRLSSEKKIDIFVPTKQKQHYFTVLDAKCTVYALERARTQVGLKENERESVDCKIAEMQLFQMLPEITYGGLDISEYTLCEVLKESGLKSKTIVDLFHAYIENNNEFYGGLALRLLVFSKERDADAFMKQETVRTGFEKAANAYRDKSVLYIHKSRELDTKLLRDNRFVMEDIIKRLNKMVSRYGIEGKTGTIHPLGC